MFAFTAVCSEQFKLKVINMLRDGKDVSWVFATIAAGMGTDIPNIKQSIIFGADPWGETFQKGGRAGRAATRNAVMVWIVEPWTFEPREIVPASLPLKNRQVKKKRSGRVGVLMTLEVCGRISRRIFRIMIYR